MAAKKLRLLLDKVFDSLNLCYLDSIRRLQRLNILRELSCEICLVYFDDIIIVGRTFKEHSINIQKMLEKLKMDYLKLNSSKCNLLHREVSYLGHVITAEGV